MPKKQPNRNSERQQSNRKSAGPHPGLQLGLTEEECKISGNEPQLKLLVSYLVKNVMDREKQTQFQKWRSGVKHEELAVEKRELSNKLWDIVERKSAALVEGASNVLGARLQTSGNAGVPNQKTDYKSAAEPAILGSPFHNPYTFIPFGQAPKRHQPTPRSVGEVELERKSGVLELKVRTISPLLTCSPAPLVPNADHKVYRALTIGNDVVLPATGVRGSLRTLMTILTGGTLGYVDENLFLTQDRDVHLGPRGPSSPPNTPLRPFLAEIVSVGTASCPGTVRPGETRLVRAESLEKPLVNLPRPNPGKPVSYLWADAERERGDEVHATVASLSPTKDEYHTWKVKLSGRPINRKGKREGLFLGNSDVIELPEKLWADYQGRNRHADHPELHTGDLIWLEPDKPDRLELSQPGHIKSLQWARWGRAGENLLDLLAQHHPAVIPDAFRDDGLVDEVTDLFGHIPHVAHPTAAPAFAARIRPENLVFFDAKSKVEIVSLAPLSSPHPGCAAFYRDCDELSDFGPGQPLRGYKVYRNTLERGPNAPWRYETQGVYFEGYLKENAKPQQKLNQTCELLPVGETGGLRIAFWDLSKRELSLLVLACSVDWRLGGGKPLGLGHCRIDGASIVDEVGDRSELFTRADADNDYPPPANIGELSGLVSDIAERVSLWHESQRPVEQLRYPRASEENNNTITIGGHIWFSRHASKRKGENVTGLEVVHVAGNSDLSTLAGSKTQINAQPLPKLNPFQVSDDMLYGYDLHLSGANKAKINRQNRVIKLEPFDPSIHVADRHKSGGNQSQNRESRDRRKDDRES